jgi:hypothetical protein
MSERSDRTKGAIAASPRQSLISFTRPLLDVGSWHVADIGQRLSRVGDAPNSGRVSEVARPTRMTRFGRDRARLQRLGKYR